MAPTHAGGVVYRINRDVPEFLLVTARRRPDAWIFPKGRLERDETPADAAAREVHEESGVIARIVELLPDVRTKAWDGEQVTRYFLMDPVQEGPSGEDRRVVWLPSDEAVRSLSLAHLRHLVDHAVDALRRLGIVGLRPRA